MAFAIYFAVFVLTSVVNGWGTLQTKQTGVEIRFLLFIPVYLVIRQMPDGTKWLLSGAILAIIATAFDAVQYLFHGNGLGSNIDSSRYHGVYSPYLPAR